MKSTIIIILIMATFPMLVAGPKYGKFKTIEYTSSGKVYRYYDTCGVDYKDISTGTIIRDKGYSDQPYVVIADDSA